MKSLSVWVVQVGENMRFAENPVPMRTGCLVEKLVKRGHRVLWWGSAFDHFKKDWLFKQDQKVSLRPGFDFMALGGIGYKKNLSLSRFIDHRILASKFRRFSPAYDRPDVMVVSTPPYDLASEAAHFAKKNKVPLIVDLRDPWPDLFVDHCPKKWQWLVRFLLGGEQRRLQNALRPANALFAVTEEMLAWGLSRAGRERTSHDRVLGLGYPTFTGAEDHVSARLVESAKKWDEKFIVLYVGAISKPNAFHNPSIMLDAARLMLGTDCHFVIAGDGEGLQDLRCRAEGLSNVTFTGWLNRSEIHYVLLRARVGLCPSSVPLEIPSNKFFAYLSAGLPVVSSFGGEIRDLIDKENVGLSYLPRDPENLVECLLKLRSDSSLARGCSENARHLFRERFDSEAIYGGFAQYVEYLANDENTSVGRNGGLSS